MNTYHLAQNNSLLKRFLNQLRDVNYQKNPLLFRQNIEKIDGLIDGILKHAVIDSLDEEKINLDLNKLILYWPIYDYIELIDFTNINKNVTHTKFAHLVNKH